MRIDRTGSHSPVSPQRGVQRQQSGGGSFAGALDGDSAGETGTVGGQALAGVDALVALQDVGDATTGREQAKQHGDRLLQRLDSLRLDLLEGRLSAETVEELAREAETARAETDDPQLDAVLDEIEVRANVELAKLGRL